MVTRTRKSPALPADLTPDCPPHHWLVETNGGAARCRKCGASNTFKNWAELNQEMQFSDYTALGTWRPWER